MKTYRAYKATYNGKCRNRRYKVGKTYWMGGEIQLCKRGFHFCLKASDTLDYYNHDSEFKLMEIEVLGKVITTNTKSVTNKFKVIRFVPNEELFDLIGEVAEFDSKGRQIHYKDCDYECWNEYDKKGRQIHYRNVEGHEYWIEYNKHGYVNHIKNANGVEEWRTVNNEGDMIHYKNSVGDEW